MRMGNIVNPVIKLWLGIFCMALLLAGCGSGSGDDPKVQNSATITGMVLKPYEDISAAARPLQAARSAGDMHGHRSRHPDRDWTEAVIAIDLGCGVNKPEGYIGLDRLPTADVQADFAQGIPLRDNSVRTLRAKDVMEHVADVIAMFNECWRVLLPDGELRVEVPRFPHVDAVKDPTHVSFFAVETFTEYLAGPDRLAFEYGMRLWDIGSLVFDDRRIWVTLTPRGKR